VRLTSAENAMVMTVTDLIRCRGDAHSHAAGVLTDDGSVFLGVNLPHYSGGPCAEVVAFGRMLTDTANHPVCIVAVARPPRSVVSPCGGCRQIMYDRWRDIGVILERAGALVRVPLLDLLPEP
jgi:cytidine deaminase